MALSVPEIVTTDIGHTKVERKSGGKTKWEYFPHDDRILVEQLPVDETSAAGIIISTGKDKAFMGTIVRVGPGKRTEDGKDRLPMTVKVGDIVVFGKYAGQETILNDERMLVMKEDDIIAIAVEKIGELVCEQCREAGLDECVGHVDTEL